MIGAASRLIRKGLTLGLGALTVGDEVSKTVKPPKRLLATSKLFGAKAQPKTPKSTSYILGA